MTDNVDRQHEIYLKEMTPRLKFLKTQFEDFSRAAEAYCYKRNKKSMGGFVKCMKKPVAIIEQEQGLFYYKIATIEKEVIDCLQRESAMNKDLQICNKLGRQRLEEYIQVDKFQYQE